LGNAVKKKNRKVANPPATSRHRYTGEELDEIVAGTEKGIRDYARLAGHGASGRPQGSAENPQAGPSGQPNPWQ